MKARINWSHTLVRAFGLSKTDSELLPARAPKLENPGYDLSIPDFNQRLPPIWDIACVHSPRNCLVGGRAVLVGGVIKKIDYKREDLFTMSSLIIVHVEESMES
jgi:hypothetical protein